MKTNTEPLKADPGWKQVNSANWQSDQMGFTLNHPPTAYADGFDKGAYALADKLLDTMQTGGVAATLEVLFTYKNGQARPTRGWKNGGDQ